MAFCINCGTQLKEGAKFCQKCGTAVENNNQEYHSQRKQEFIGKIYKCPNCGQILSSFVRNCPSCGLELRGIKVTNAVREFALKLEAIESQREYERPRGLFSRAANTDRIAKTDEQKISLIQSFSVPNTMEDMLEFMILATSNVNLRVYDSSNTNISKSETAISDAWMSKIKQVHEKAKQSFGNSEDLQEIERLYNDCQKAINKSKRKGIAKLVMMIGWLPLLFVIVFIILGITGPIAHRQEVERLESIEQVVNEALENGDYKKALRNAEIIEYDPEVRHGNYEGIKKQWDVKRELLIDEIIEKAEANGVHLERSIAPEQEDKGDAGEKSTGFMDYNIEFIEVDLKLIES